MNTYTYNEINVGIQEEFEVTITDEMMKQFEVISGDINPLHIDEGYAKKKGMLGRVVYGMLTSSFYSKLVGVYLPGEKCLLQEIDISFRSPVYINDKLTVIGKVVSKNDIFNQVTIKAWVINGEGKKVSKARIKVGVLA